ncbi:ATP-binding protein, partial [Calothrix sp. UHCC 0171]|nr:ATP-binding protein [Calothrix sp. UHCC 0171]
MSLNHLHTLFDTRQAIVALETPVTERKRVLQILSQLAKQHNLPLYFWNIGYSKLQQVDDSSNLNNSNIPCKSGLEWLFNNPTIPGVFAFESVISSTGTIAPETRIILSNLAYSFPISHAPKFIICLESYVELPSDLLPLIPVVYNSLPNISQVESFIVSKSNFTSHLKANPQLLEPFVRACLGLPLGELEILFTRLLRLCCNLEELIDGVLSYKKSKLKNQGVEFLSEPDVPQAAGLDLLEDILERAAVLLKPEAKKHNLSFPKGMILWGAPGTGKSLSAKLAA